MYMLETTPLHWISIFIESQSSEVAMRLRQESKKPRDEDEKVMIYRVNSGAFLFRHKHHVTGFSFGKTDSIDGMDLTVVNVKGKAANAVAVALVDGSPRAKCLSGSALRWFIDAVWKDKVRCITGVFCHTKEPMSSLDKLLPMATRVPIFVEWSTAAVAADGRKVEDLMAFPSYTMLIGVANNVTYSSVGLRSDLKGCMATQCTQRCLVRPRT